MEFMSTDRKLSFSTTSCNQSLAFGEKLAKFVRPGQLIEFAGDLGGGKTTIIKGLARGLGITKTVTSPTFNITRGYELPGGGSLEHFDLYRLENDEMMLRELKEVISEGQNIVVIEWAKPFIRHLADDYLLIDLQFVDETTRHIEVTATGPKSQQTIEALQ